MTELMLGTKKGLFVLTGEPGAPRVVEGGGVETDAELLWALRAGGELYLRYALASRR